MSNPQKARGSAFEREVVKYLQDQGFPFAERLYGAGRWDDKGDITLGADRFRRFVHELKNHATFKFPEWLEEARIECENAKGKYPIVIAKRRTKSPSQAYVVMTLETWVQLLKDEIHD